MDRLQIYRSIHTCLGLIFLASSLLFLIHSIGGVTGFSVIENLGTEKNTALGSILLLGSAIMFRLGMRKIRKGQAAMEFLMTYGWTILAAILVLGTLSYFSFFNPAKLSPDATILEPPFYAIAASADEDSINFGIRNNGDKTYIITGIAVENCGSYTSPFNIAPGATVDISIQCNAPLAPETRFSEDIQITYHASGSTVDRNAEGTISTNVQPGTGQQLNPSQVCGNGNIEPPETCDDGNLVNGDGCSADCTLETQVCGNNIVEGAEVCDGTDLAGKDDCTDLAMCSQLADCPYVGPTLSCELDCSGYELATCQLTECSDGIDNDLSGKFDYPADPGCTNANDNDESVLPGAPVECADGIDNDGDTKIDFPSDPGCTSSFDGDETDAPKS